MCICQSACIIEQPGAPSCRYPRTGINNCNAQSELLWRPLGPLHDAILPQLLQLLQGLLIFRHRAVFWLHQVLTKAAAMHLPGC